MNCSLNKSIFFNYLLKFQKTLKTSIYREIRKLPFYDTGKPYERTHIIESDWSKCFIRTKDFKSCIKKLFYLGFFIKSRKWILSFR